MTSYTKTIDDHGERIDTLVGRAAYLEGCASDVRDRLAALEKKTAAQHRELTDRLKALEQWRESRKKKVKGTEEEWRTSCQHMASFLEGIMYDLNPSHQDGIRDILEAMVAKHGNWWRAR